MQEESRNFKTILIVSSKSYKMVLHSQSKAECCKKWIIKVQEWVSGY